jgi:hypothetical protein
VAPELVLDLDFFFAGFVALDESPAGAESAA